MPYVVKILFWLIEIVLLIVSLYFIFFEKMGKFPERLLRLLSHNHYCKTIS